MKNRRASVAVILGIFLLTNTSSTFAGSRHSADIRQDRVCSDGKERRNSGGAYG